MARRHRCPSCCQQRQLILLLFFVCILLLAGQVHYILGELCFGGLALETNMAEILAHLDEQNKLEKQEVIDKTKQSSPPLCILSAVLFLSCTFSKVFLMFWNVLSRGMSYSTVSRSLFMLYFQMIQFLGNQSDLCKFCFFKFSISQCMQLSRIK